MASERPILIAGGGLGGLSAALALGRKGFSVRVLEQAEKFAPIGYGIQLGPNVFPMFARLGVTEAVMREASIPTNTLMLDALSGEEVTHIPTGENFRARLAQDGKCACADQCRQRGREAYPRGTDRACVLDSRCDSPLGTLKPFLHDR